MRAFLFTTLALSTLAAQAADISLKGDHNPAAENSFSLDFGDGNPRTAFISDTTYDLRVDEITGTAKFVSYEQFVDPIEIPVGPGQFLSTGDLTIRVLPGTSTGSYADATGVFTTAESYEISFTGDLSPIGFSSPVILPSASSGTVTFGTDISGTVNQIWQGETLVGQFPLRYTCRVNTTFAVRFPGDLNCDTAVSAQDISPFVTAITNPAAFAEQFPNCDIGLADINGDGFVSVGDISPFVNLLTQ